MSLDHELLNEVYLRDPGALGPIFEANRKPLVVLLVNQEGEVSYANDAAHDAIGFAARARGRHIRLDVTEDGFLGTLIERARAPGAVDASILATLAMSGEEWIVLAACVERGDRPAVAVFAGRRPLSPEATSTGAPRERIFADLEHPLGLYARFSLTPTEGETL